MSARNISLRNIPLLAASLALIGALAVLAAACGSGSTASADTASQLLTGRAGPVEIQADLAQSKYLLGGDGRFSLRLTIMGDLLEDHRPSRPVDLVLVLDRSGSMSGDKIADVKEAVLGLLDHMTPDDRLALVSYANGVTVHGPLTRADAKGRTLLAREVLRIEAGGNTNLGAGLSEGLRLLERTEGNRSARLVLLSDGLANEGVIDPDRLGAMASRGMEMGVAVSTVGVGLDFNERLMTSLADHGGGDYTFLEDPAWFAETFHKELRNARQVAARSLEIRVPLPVGVRLEYAAGYPVRIEGGEAVFQPGAILTGQTRELFLTFVAPTDQVADYAFKDLSVKGMAGEDRFETRLSGTLEVACTADRKAAEDSIRADVWEAQTLRQDYNRLKDEVAERVKQGDLDGAMQQIDRYERDKVAANQAVGSSKVAENLADDLPQLKQEVEQALSPSATAEEQERYSKTLQSESYKELRAKGN